MGISSSYGSAAKLSLWRVNDFGFDFRNKAIADYLRSSGYTETFQSFQEEANIDAVSCQAWFQICSSNFFQLWVTDLRSLDVEFALK